MLKFTVLLRFPDYLGGNWPDDMYWVQVRAASPKGAVYAARRDFKKNSEHAAELKELNDMAVVAVIAGHVDILAHTNSGL